MVLIDNTNRDDLSLKRPFSPDDDEESPDKKYRTNLILGYLRAFSTALLSQPKKMPVDNLPKEPDNWSEVQFHAYKAEWHQAMQIEYDKAVSRLKELKEAYEQNKEYPYILSTGRATAGQWHTQTRTREIPAVEAIIVKEGYININTDTI